MNDLLINSSTSILNDTSHREIIDLVSIDDDDDDDDENEEEEDNEEKNVIVINNNIVTSNTEKKRKWKENSNVKNSDEYDNTSSIESNDKDVEYIVTTTRKKSKEYQCTSNSSIILLQQQKTIQTKEINTSTLCRLVSTEKELCTIDIYRGDGDDGIVTTGLSCLIETFSKNNDERKSLKIIDTDSIRITYKYLCCNKREEKNSNRINFVPEPPTIIPKDTLVHIQQKDKWSCGYRNLQMLLSVIIPNVLKEHPIHALIQMSNNHIYNHTKQQQQEQEHYQYDDHNTTSISIPSVLQCQKFIEESWKEGFDSIGRKHFHNHMLGKKGHHAEIGAVEISSILSYLFVDSTVIQFIACYQSRSLLGHFVWTYFNKLPFGSSTSCYYCKGCGIVRSIDTSYEILQYVSSPSNNNNNNHYNERKNNIDYGHYCDHPLLPLYLQWQGHSVMCIGIERFQKLNDDKLAQSNDSDDGNFDTRKEDDNCDYNFLIYDPLKSGDNLKKVIKQEITNNNETNTGQKNILRLPMKELIVKDCQIVLCSLKPLTDNIRKSRAFTTNSNVLTAAHDHVESVLRKRVQSNR